MTSTQLDTLKQRWTRFSQRALLPCHERLWSAIESLHTEADRHYHSLEHVSDCLTRLDA